MTAPVTTALLDARTIEDYRTHGVAIIRGLLTADEVALVAQGIEQVLADPSPMFKVASKTDDPGRFVEDFCNWQRIEQFARIVSDSRVADVAAELMGSDQVRLFHDHVLVKEPGTRQHTPWHQDQPYYNVDGSENCSIWMPVDPVAKESTLEFVAGSHRGGWLMPRSFMDTKAHWFPEGSLHEIPDIEGHREDYDIRSWAMEPGDAVAFNMLTLHHAYGVPGKNRRRAFSLRFLGDDMVHAPRDWTTSPDFSAHHLDIPAGAPMEHPLFPVLRTRSTDA